MVEQALKETVQDTSVARISNEELDNLIARDLFGWTGIRKQGCIHVGRIPGRIEEDVVPFYSDFLPFARDAVTSWCAGSWGRRALFAQCLAPLCTAEGKGDTNALTIYNVAMATPRILAEALYLAWQKETEGGEKA